MFGNSLVKNIISFTVLIVGVFIAKSQDDVEYVSKAALSFENKIYDDAIHTINFHKLGSQKGMPIIRLSGSEKLKLSFDDFSMKIEDLNYKIIHCDQLWNASDLQYFQYIRGAEEPFINDYVFSTSFNQSYVEYNLLLPNDEITFKVSGNYLIYIYRNGDPSKLLFSHQFYVTEDLVKINASVRAAFDPAYRNSKQEIDFSIDHSNLQIINPSDAIKVTLIQNSRTDNEINDLKPLFISNNTLEYNYNDKNSFWAGNEQRYVNLRNLSQKTEFINDFVTRIDSTHIFVVPMNKRNTLSQTSLIGNLYGDRVIGSTAFNHTAASDIDYCMVYFYLNQEEKDTNGNFYVFGELSNFMLENRFKMKYDVEKKRYRLPVYLKQGIYNWLVMYSKDGKIADVKKIEGSFSDAQNRYTILVYYKNFTDNYTRIIKEKTVFFPNNQKSFQLNSK